MDERLFCYHPYRYAYQMDGIFKKTMQDYQAAPADIKKGTGSLLIGSIFHEYLQSVVQSHSELFRKHHIVSTKEWIEHKESLLTYYMDFLQEDERVFQFEPSWMKCVDKETIQDRTLGELQLPSMSFYLHFNRVPHLDMWTPDYGFEGRGLH